MAVTPAPGLREYIYDNGSERSANGTLGFYEPEHFHLDDWMQIVTMLLASLGLVGNGTVLWLLGFRIQRNPFSVYILNLAASDALFLCGAFLISLDGLFNLLFTYVTYVVLFLITYMFYTVGVSLLAAISTQRCLSVLFPIWYHCHCPKRMSAVVCAVLWTMGILLWLFYAVFDILLEYVCPYYDPGHIVLGVLFTLLTCVLCVSSLTLLLRVQCSSQRRQPTRFYLLVLLTVLVFLLCGLAPGISAVSWLFGRIFVPFWISWLLACVNSSANPLIYFFLGSQRHKRREPLRVLLQRALADDGEMGRESGEMPCTQTRET